MNKKIKKRVKAYKAIYEKVLKCSDLEHAEKRLSAYEKCLTEMYASKKFSARSFPLMISLLM